MAILPCSHPENLIQQIEPTKELLKHMDARHPAVLESEGITPADYHDGMVFRSAIESIRGTFAATTSPRTAFTNGILERMRQANLVSNWQPIGGRGRCDYSVMLTSGKKEIRVAIESKGGEGNSFNIGDRPNWSDEYIIWGHLDGAIVNQPAHGAASNLFTRLSAEIIANGKTVDAYVVLDRFCGTKIRPCPKMPKDSVGRVIPPPCVFLLPRGIPTAANPSPRRARLNEVSFINNMLALSGVPESQFARHVKTVTIEVFKQQVVKRDGLYKSVPIRRVTVYQGDTVLETKDMTITRGDKILEDSPTLRDKPAH
jgi:hypothetical protein